MQPFTLSARFYPPDLLNNNSLSPSSSTLCARLDYSHQQGNISLFLRSHFWIISLIPLALPLTSLFFAPLCNAMSRRLLSHSPSSCPLSSSYSPPVYSHGSHWCSPLCCENSSEPSLFLRNENICYIWPPSFLFYFKAICLFL